MLLMNEYVLSFEEKPTQPWFSYAPFKLPASTKNR